MEFKKLGYASLFFIMFLSSSFGEDLKSSDFQDFKEELSVTEGHFKSEKLVNIRDSKTGLEVDHQTKNDLSRFNFAILFNSNWRKITNIRTLEVGYGIYRNENLFIDLFANVGDHIFDSITEQNPSMAVSPDDIKVTEEDLIMVGFGFTYRTNFIRDFLRFNNLYETVSSSLGFTWMMEELSDRNYFGPGIKADLGIHYRASQNFHVGVKLSWNHFSTLRREDFDFESKSRRHLALTWLGLGLDFAIYY